jgi:uncharacterized protein (DUF1501 family)
MGISRRLFLKGSLGAIGLTLPVCELLMLAMQSTEAAPRKVGSSRILVVIQLAGGNDGLNTIVPYTDDAYYKARPAIGVKQKDALQLDSKLGFNPAASELSELYKQGKVTIVQGVGYPEPNRSHFRSIEIWQTAEPRKVKDTGWLGRYLDYAYPEHASAKGELRFPAINVEPILPKTLSGQRVVVPSISDLGSFRFQADPKNEADRKAQVETFNAIYRDFNTDRKFVEKLRLVGMDTTRASDYLQKLAEGYKTTAEYPNDAFGTRMKFIAQMITSGLNCNVYNVSINGFDTHTNQQRDHERMLRRLSSGIKALQSDLESHGVDKDVLIMTFSEFGRRVAENNGRGTDHGAAAPMLLVGSSVKGGITGEHPSLTDLQDGDLKYKIDFRNVYATVLDKWLRADSKQLLGDRFDTLDFV